jgi:hypothetical protein
MKLENMNLDELIELENQIKIEKNKRFQKTEIIVDNDIDRESLKDKNGYINCSVLPGVSIDNFPFSERFEIIEDLDLLPEEVNNVNFKFGKVNFDTSVIEEEFVYFYHRIFIHAIDPKSYGLKDGLLIITEADREPEYHTGYLFFRYYKGKFYLIEHYRPVNITPQHTRQLINWINNNQDDSLNKLYKDYHKIYPKGGHK